MRTFLVSLACLTMTFTGCASSQLVNYKSDGEFLKQLPRQKLTAKLALAPVNVQFKGQRDALIQQDQVIYRPELTNVERTRWTSKIEESLQLLLESKLERVSGGLSSTASVSSESYSERFVQFAEDAENRGADLILRVDFKTSELRYNGPKGLGWFCDVAVLLLAPPFHWWIPDESFEFVTEADLSVYEVRNPRKPLYTVPISAKYEKTLDEFDHRLVLLNPILAFWQNGVDRFDRDNFAYVYQQFLPHCEDEFLRNVINEVGGGLRAQLESPLIKNRLRQGDPESARLYAVIVGQNHDMCQNAVADADQLTSALQKRGLLSRYIRKTTGKVTKLELVNMIKKLPTKSVDRVLFYFSGQGIQDARGQSLRLSSGESISTIELAVVFESVAAKNVSFLLDTSFGDTTRSQRPGGRTDKESIASLPRNSVVSYLKPLANSSRGWQVVCPAQHNEMTGELRGHGLLTSLVLSEFKQTSSEITLATLCDAIESQLIRRAKVLFGGNHSLIQLPVRDRQRFVLGTSQS